jgi:hypothetical protein
MKFVVRINLIALAMLMTILSCSKDSFPSDTIIKLRYECGWCSFRDVLLISSDSVIYTDYKNKCYNSDPPDTIIYDFISNKDLTSLMKNLDIKKYMACTYDHCGTCYDGCDFTLNISAKGQSNSIRYVSLAYDSTMIWMVPFVSQLNGIRNKYVPSPW